MRGKAPFVDVTNPVYARVLEQVSQVPGLNGETGHTGDRNYYRNAQENIAYIEQHFMDSRFFLGGIWVAPHQRGKGIAYAIPRALLEAAVAADLSIELGHEPFGNEGLKLDELEDFYNRRGFTQHRSSREGMVRSPLDLYRS